MSSSDSEEEQVDSLEAPTIDTPEVVTKYRLAGEMANDVIRQVVAKLVPGASVIDVCKFGDDLILKKTQAVYNKKVADKDGKLVSVEKGIAFPTCISPNHLVAHLSPLESEEPVILNDGDVVKVDLGVHIDGYIGVVGTTHVIGSSLENPVTGRKADVLAAGYYAAEAAIRMLVPGTHNSDVTDAIGHISAAYDCKPIEGMLSYQLKKDVIDGDKAIIQNPTEDQMKSHKKEKFEELDVFAIDVLCSTGEGKTHKGNHRTTVHKRNGQTYQLKMKVSRQLFAEVSKKFTVMPFTLRACEDEKKARMGVVECVKHDILGPMDVYCEKEGEFVSQFKFTVLMMKSGQLRITNSGFDPAVIKSDKSLDTLLAKAEEDIKAHRDSSEDNQKYATQIDEVKAECAGDDAKYASKMAALKKKDTGIRAFEKALQGLESKRDQVVKLKDTLAINVDSKNKKKNKKKKKKKAAATAAAGDEGAGAGAD
jgi:curved DNA binding protein